MVFLTPHTMISAGRIIMAQTQASTRYSEGNELPQIARTRKGNEGRKKPQLGWSRTDSWKSSRLWKLVGFWFLMDPSWSLTKTGI